MASGSGHRAPGLVRKHHLLPPGIPPPPPWLIGRKGAWVGEGGVRGLPNLRTSGKVNTLQAGEGGTLGLEKSSLCPQFTRRGRSLVAGHQVTKRLDHWVSTQHWSKAACEGVFSLQPAVKLYTYIMCSCLEYVTYLLYIFKTHIPGPILTGPASECPEQCPWH